MKTKPVYLIPGGPDASEEQLVGDFRAALASCGTRGPAVAYVGTASLDDESFFRDLRGNLLDAGAGSVALAPISGEGADIASAGKLLAEADAVFLSGGEVADGMAGLTRSGLDALLTRLYRDGKFFFGLSAGCIMMGRCFPRWKIEGDDGTASLFPCLDFVPLTFDAHGESEDWTELRCAVRLLGDGGRGYGLSTGGLYTADRRGRLTSLRNGPAVFVNVRGSVDAATASAPHPPRRRAPP